MTLPYEPMNARDEAIAAIYGVGASMFLAIAAVDALSDDLLARLAIERGALQDQTLDWWTGAIPGDETLYRLVTQ